MSSSEQIGDYLLASSWFLEALYNGDIPSVTDIAHPEFWRKHHTRLFKEEKCCHHDKIDIFQILSRLAEHYLATKHSGLYIRTEKLEEWQQLRSTTCTLPILAAASHCRNLPTRHRLLMPLIAKNKIYSFAKGFSETHLHFKAYTYPEEQWLTALHQPERASRAIGCVIRIHDSIFKTKPFAHDSGRIFLCLKTALCIRENLIETLSYNKGEASLKLSLLDIISETENRFLGIPHTECMVDLEVRGATNFWEMESLLWLRAFSAAKQYESCRSLLAALLHFYLLLENDISLYFRGESGTKGLVNLKPIYSIHQKMPKETQYESRMLRRLLKDTYFSSVNQVELRLPCSALKNNRVGLLQESGTASLHLGALGNSSSGFTSLHTAAHIIKSAYGKKTRAKSLAQIMEDSRNETAYLSPYLKTDKYQFLRLDAAGATLDVPPETLAPAYRYLSDKLKGKTFHCGEDFRHLISGIREIADSIRFLNLGEGDRIGHAISIGINPKKWLDLQEKQISIPRHEWLMNLLYLLETTRHNFPASIGAWQLRAARQQWENEALHLARNLFPNSKELKRTGALRLLHLLYVYRHLYAPYLKTDSPAEISRMDETEHLLIERAHLTNAAGLQNLLIEWNDIRPANPECIDIPGDYIPADVLIKLQQQVQQTIKAKGLVIEVCLVSNARISAYTSLKNHHILRWLKLKDKFYPGDISMDLCLGSDDPGIFCTNTASEYYHLICLLRRCGLKPRSVRRIISRIISCGNTVLRGR